MAADNQRIKELETQLEKAKEDLKTQLEKAKGDLKTKDDEIAKVVKSSKEEMKRQLETYKHLFEERFDVCKKKGIYFFEYMVHEKYVFLADKEYIRGSCYSVDVNTIIPIMGAGGVFNRALHAHLQELYKKDVDVLWSRIYIGFMKETGMHVYNIPIKYF